jgi:hypothetical protein
MRKPGAAVFAMVNVMLMALCVGATAAFFTGLIPNTSRFVARRYRLKTLKVAHDAYLETVQDRQGKHDALRATNEYGEFENSQEGFEFRVGLTKRRLPVYEWCRDNHLVFKAFTEENAELARGALEVTGVDLNAEKLVEICEGETDDVEILKNDARYSNSKVKF